VRQGGLFKFTLKSDDHAFDMMLNIDALHEHVRRHYGIHGTITPVPMGRASNYAVSQPGSRWLLKVFQPEYTRTRIEQSADFVTFLVSAGFPAREFVPSTNGASVLTLEDRATVLIPWIEGETPTPNTLSTLDALEQVGALCGHVHRLGGAYPRAATLSYAGSKRDLVGKRAALLRVAAEQSDEPDIVKQIGVRTSILDALGEALDRSLQDARRGVIHGDFSAAHVVFKDGRSVGVIDVVGEQYLPGWELMRAFFQSVPFAGESPMALEAPWRAYVGGYARECSIQPDEIAVAYDTYLLQLTTSTYGLREPLDESLRAFGRWRTQLAHQLAEHRREFRAMMASQVRS
jgi:Ser/Thr protein kinase RdoA (MazF antagonist)